MTKNQYHFDAVHLGFAVILLLSTSAKALATVEISEPALSMEVPNSVLNVPDYVNLEATDKDWRTGDRLTPRPVESITIAHPGPTDKNGCHTDKRGVWHCH